MVVKHDASLIVDGLFRRESARLVASLTRVFGPSNVDLVEDVVQDALEMALQAWKLEIPDNPAAWLSRVARNRAIDTIRAQKTRLRFSEEHSVQLESGWTRTSTIDEALAESSSDENQLRMMFSLCHPGLAAETHVTLILRFLCGLSNRELSKAYLVSEDTIKKRVTRGKSKLRELGSLPTVEAESAEKIDSVLKALYLLFNEGYHGSHPTSPTRALLCEEALRLCSLLTKKITLLRPQAHALMALMYLHYARIGSRFDDQGEIVTLEHQDRSLWSKELIGEGIKHMGLSASGDRMSEYHLEAGIACQHSIAESFEVTDWKGILELYDLLFQMSPNPLIKVIRATVRAYSGGVSQAVEEISEMATDKAMKHYPFYWAAKAEIHALNGDIELTREGFDRAAALSRNAAEKNAWNRRKSEFLGSCNAVISVGDLVK